jgi:hypothetical protein
MVIAPSSAIALVLPIPFTIINYEDWCECALRFVYV